MYCNIVFVVGIGGGGLYQKISVVSRFIADEVINRGGCASKALSPIKGFSSPFISFDP